MEREEILDGDFEDASDDADNEFLNDPSSTQPSSGPPSTPNSCTSSPPVNNEESISPHRNFYSGIVGPNGGSVLSNFSGGKPYGPKRGPGRPRKEYHAIIRTVKDARGIIRKFRSNSLKGTSKKKFIVKDEKNSLFNLSLDSSILHNLPKSPSEFSTEQSPTDMMDQMIQPSDEMPYFPEKWSGKLCALCNLGERSQMGQGEMLRLEITDTDQEFFGSSSPSLDDKDCFSNDPNMNSSMLPHLSNRRQKGLNKCKNPVNTSDYVDELEKVGYMDAIEFCNIQDANYYYVHRLCATWSFGVQRETSGALGKISSVISHSLRRKCAYCSHYGASVACKMSCPKFFHLPCVAASGGFQIIQNYSSFCREHLEQVPLFCSDNINCRSCSGLGDVCNLVMCSICGDHYHGTCIGLPQMPGVRAGWQCVSCRKCQICRVPDSSEGRSLACEQCHKVYHAHCLRPVMSSIPKYGWKCRRCRVCSDCGSRTPGAGASSRWHSHYTVCDSCYQQRNKGFSCPICHRAYRAAAYREMVKCNWCNKFVHSTCDSEADLSVYHAKKENNPDYYYVCPPCKSLIQSGRLSQTLARRNSNIDDDSMSTIQDYTCMDDGDGDMYERSSDYGLGKGKPYSAIKIAKKRMNLSFGQIGRTKGKLAFQKRPRLAEFGRKRGPKTKMRGMFGVPGLGLQRPTNESFNSKTDDEPGIENRLVLCSAKDKFILTQDICVMCGAIGTDQEGCLISCTQCGQCYHPYCVNVKVTKVILNKGWRCLDCTVCEGCGQKNDEARLILCDECDISFHIYCMDPPLECVPQGNWKCKWCAICQKCGRNSAGKNCNWKNSYSECGPCASQISCPSCFEMYNDSELIIQCTHCERWLHCKCDSIKNEDEAEKCDDEGYTCILCRPKDVPPPHLLPPKKLSVQTNRLIQNGTKSEEISDTISHGLEGNHFIDGVCLSEHGLNLIKSLQMEYIRKKRKQKLCPEININNKDAGILAAIESVVAGSGIEFSLDEIKVEPLDPKEEAEMYKDGMVWDRSDASPPEGFSLCTNEQGVVVLRKKRQRNLQKLGIGGFNVRNRAIKKEGTLKDEFDDNGDNGISYIDNLPIEKKKKPLRKKQKSKLTETYPPYLQEAFFGKNLLDTNKTIFESDSSEDETKSNVSDDKIIKLSPEELKMLDCIKIEQKTTSDIKENDENLKTENSNLNDQNNDMSCETDIDNSDAEALKDIIPHELLDSELVNSIINDSDDLSKASGSLNVQDDSSLTSRKDDLADILCPNFNLDSIDINCKDVEEIFQGVIEEDSKSSCLNKTNQSIVTSSNTVYQKTNEDIQYGANTQLTNQKPTQTIINNFVPTPQTFSNPSLKSPEQPLISPVNIPQSYITANDQKKSVTSPITFSSNSMQCSWSSNSSSPRQNLDHQTSIEEIPGIIPITQNNCSQKSSERMRRDEELGEMATISAVLYANTNHPELKIEYPNWVDRCKQIYKKWRSLNNDKKAPFLQQARDNRSALRMKKVQQDQEKITSQQKSLKEQEQERQWKQLQAMRAKEQQMQQFTTCPLNRDGSNPNPPNIFLDQNQVVEKRSIYTNIPGTPRPQFGRDIIQPTVYATQLDSYSNPVLTISGQQLTEKPVVIKQQQENNKQLRDLLQRQENGSHNVVQQQIPVVQSNSTIPTRWMQDEQPMGQNQNTAFCGSTFREPFPVAVSNRTIKTPTNLNTIRLNTSPVGQPTSINQQPPQSPSPLLQFQAQRTPPPPPSQSPNSFDLEKRIKRPKESTENEYVILKAGEDVDKAVASAHNKSKIKEEINKSGRPEIPDNVTAELEKLEQDDNVVMAEVEGVGDILGGLGEDDDDELLNSLTAEMGDDFNILEYADPELDALTCGNNHNLLDKLDFDDGDAEERLKKSGIENKYVGQSNNNPQDRQTMIQIPIARNSDQVIASKNKNDINIRRTPTNEVQNNHERQNFIIAPTNRTIVTTNINQAKVPENIYRVTNLPRYNIISQNPVCKMPRPNLAPPPPPYPGPPPPYPAASNNIRHHQINVCQEQPLLLEDLLEQEKREQQQQQQQQQMTSSIITNQMIKKDSSPLVTSNLIKVENVPRNNLTGITNWRKNSSDIMQHVNSINNEIEPKIKKEIINVPILNTNFQGPPPLPPDNIITEQDHILQMNYEQWLNNHNMVLSNQLKYYEDEVFKLRKMRKSLNSKQRLMKKSGGELSPQDAMEFTKVASEQAIIQKHLELSRKLCRQHALLVQEYKTKNLSKIQMPSPNIPSPAQMTPLSPMLSPSTSSQSPLLMQTSSSPLGNHMLQSTRSPLHSPSPQIGQQQQQQQQQHMHQNMSPLESPQPIVSPSSMHSFSPSPDAIQSQRTMHFIQQRQIVQRQQSNPNQMNQTIVKPKNQPASSPIHNHSMNSPSSPLLQYNIQQHNINRRPTLDTVEPYGSPHQYISQCRDNIMPSVSDAQQNYMRNNQDGNGSGGGLSSLTGSFLPIPCSSNGRYGKIRLGLFGGSPMWNMTTLNKKHGDNIHSNKSDMAKNSAECSKSSNVLLCRETGIISELKHNVETSQDTSTTRSGKKLMNTEDESKCNLNVNEVVIIDSSPDEKQRIMDYDDFQDKGFVTTEVSLNSAAQNIADSDDITVIESFASSELTDIVSSPLESEVAEEYVLFSTDVVDYADSDDSLKRNSMSSKADDVQTQKADSNSNDYENDYDTLRKLDNNGNKNETELLKKDDTESNDNEINISPTIKSPEIKNFATAEDFEAMIDCRNTKDDDSVSIFETDSVIPPSSKHVTKSLISTTNVVTTSLLTCNRIPFTSVQCGVITSNSTQTTSSTALVVTPKKIVTDVTQATAKVSIGNTTISVPLLKTMTLNSTQTKVSTGVNLQKQPTILNVRGQKLNPGTIVSLSSLQLKPSTSAKIVQATVVGKKLQLPQQSTIENVTNVKHNLIHTFSYPKLSSLTVLQDMALPNKIFEDESISPDSSLEHDDSESLSRSIENMETESNSAIKKAISPQKTEEQKTKETSTNNENSSLTTAENIQKDQILISNEGNNQDVVKRQARLISVVPQLSPLSQPTEMTTNMANVSQQLRTIMSSISTTVQSDKKSKEESNLNKETSMASTSKINTEKLQIKDDNITGSEQKLIILETDQHNKKNLISKDGTNTIKVFLTSSSNLAKFSDKILNSNDDKCIQLQHQSQQMIKKTKIVPTSIFSTMLSSSTVVKTATNCNLNSNNNNNNCNSSSNINNISQVPVTQIQNRDVSSGINISNYDNNTKKTTKFIFTQHLPTSSVKTPTTTGIITAHLKRSKSTDDGIEMPAQISGNKRLSLELTTSKIDANENTDKLHNSISITSISPTVTTTTISSIVSRINEQTVNGCQISNVINPQPINKSDETQNVLLKQLLQNSGSSNTNSSQVITGRKVPGLRAPSLGVVSSLEDQLSRPVIPPVPSNPPSLLPPTTTSTQTHPKLSIQSTPSSSIQSMDFQNQKTNETDDDQRKTSQQVPRETSFISNAVIIDQKNDKQNSNAKIDLMKPEPKRTELDTGTVSSICSSGVSGNSQTFKISQKEVFSDNTPVTPTHSTQSYKVMYNEDIKIKSEIQETSPTVKKSTSIPYSYGSSNHSMNINNDISEEIEQTLGKDDKNKIMDSFDSGIELKKRKKREYQKNRRQMQLLNKEVVYSKKRPRKLSKFDEDYDNFIDNLMIQLRQMSSLQVLEPLLSRNYGICPPYGTGDLSKIGINKESVNCQQSSTVDQLNGEFGNATSSNIIDFYNTKPFGTLEVPPETNPTPIHNGFYDQEFPPIKFESDFDQTNRFDYIFKDRDIDTPESIVTSSSPECVTWETTPSFPGLHVISHDSDDEFYGPMSPVVPVITPIPIKLQAGMDLSIDKKQFYDSNKENSLCGDSKNKIGQNANKDSNVTVTLTLTSSAAEDIMGVLRDLANILHIPPPTSYQIVERTTTPPSQKLGLYRTKGKDGKEGDPIDIQTILNGSAKFCRHCDVVILNTMIRAKASEFPLLASNELLNNSDDLYFCSKTCYKQFKWRPTNIIDDSETKIKSSENLNNSSENGSTSNFSKDIKLENNQKMSARNNSLILDELNSQKDTASSQNSDSNSSSSQALLKPLSSKLKLNDSTTTTGKTSRFKYFSVNLFNSPNKYKKPSDKEITEMLFRMNITVAPLNRIPEDTRQCIFCGQSGDGVADGPSRLLNFDIDKWVHLNCALWSDGVYETVNGALMNLEAALQASLNQICTVCHQLGATIKCFKNRCGNIYHLSCGMKDKCVFYKNKTTHCVAHALKNEKENELTTLSVQRRVYVERDESRQVAAVMHHSELSNLLRVGSLTFLNVGQLLPHQLQAFHTPNYIYPIGYKIIRFYWSMRNPNKRCRYICSIADVSGRPEFRILVQEATEEDVELRDSTPKSVWLRILEPMSLLRKNCDLVQLFPKYVTGEDLFGLTEPAVVRILESLPGIETLTDYRFKYGRNPLLELPLAINPSGAARTEPKQKQTVGWRKPHTQRSGSANQRTPLAPTTSVAGEVACPYSKQFVHSKSSQYKKMKQEWRNNVYLARSKIQGLGLYAARDLEKHTMVIEYIGEVIRTEVSEIREKQYESRNRGIYMFRLDEDRVVDATLSGGLARYINHSCNPNCVTEIVEVDREYRIIIFAKRRINRGEELSYDYKFDIEDDAHKISCMCGAPNCRKWMN